MVTNRKDPEREHEFREVAPGWYLNTHRGNMGKKKIMETIAKNLGIKVKIDVE